MNFFQHQDNARRSTWRLVLLFVLAVASLVLLTNLLLVAALAGFGNLSVSSIESTLFVQVSIAVVGTIGLVMLFKWLQLRGGGRVVAEQMGGVPVTYASASLEQRRLLNVVEEMAIAAGLPVPPVYVLEEPGINAFAAGYSPNDAVIGITRGALQALDRDQLQGVIGHEFSHILHGDMRLNLRLIAVLAGILFIGQAGRVVLSGNRRRSLLGSRSRSKNSMPLVVVALGLLAIGYLGMLLGNLIRAAVSRQREFLADASAVQYTRNPEGIAGALKVIAGSSAGSLLYSSKTEENSHLFFGNALARKASSAFATHPPIEQRIRRITPNWDGQYLQPVDTAEHTAAAETAPAELSAAFHTPAATMSLAGDIQRSGELNQSLIEYSQQRIADIPEQLLAACQHPYYARALVFALLLHGNGGDNKDPEVHARQLALLEDGIRLRQRTEELLPAVKQLAAHQRLPLVELLVPALKQLSFRQYQSFTALQQQLIDADQTVDAFEWMLQRLLKDYLDGSYTKPGREGSPIRSLHQVDAECFDLLSLLAHLGHGSFYPAESAFYRGLAELNIGPACMVPEAQLTFARINLVLNRLKRLRPQLKQQLLLCCAVCIEADQTVTSTERELLRVVAVSLGCPVPVV